MLTRRSFLQTSTAALAASAADGADSKTSVDLKRGDLRVSDNHRFLVHADGTPFFYLGDTAWELFHRLNREEAERYLENRRSKGFNVIQAVALAELDGLRVKNAYGHTPLIDDNPDQPNAAYFEHVDYVVGLAAKKGMFIGFLPTWGNKVVKGSWEKTAPVVFNSDNARRYGRWIGSRYRNRANLIWILGGDRSPKGVEPVWRAMAAGLKDGDGGRHLMTYHPNGASSSSEFLHSESWLDFNMMQSGHSRRNERNDLRIEHDYALKPTKPVLDGEPRYENHPVDWKPEQNGWFDENDVRQAAYWAVFAGACGHTYGCHDIWQMLAPGREPVGLARGTWATSLDLPGSRQVGYVRRLIESRPYLSRVPDQALIDGDPGSGEDAVRATRGDGYAFVYIPTGKPVSLKLGALGAKEMLGWWFDPRTGEATRIGKVTEARLTPRGKPGRGNDWVLVIDDAAKRFRAPGQAA